jgi:integrase
MTRYPRTPEACIAKFLADIEKEPLTLKSKQSYSSTVRIITRDLIAGGRNALPYKITEDDVRWLLLESWMRLQIKTRKGYRSVLAKYTTHFGNHVTRSVKIRFPHDMRPNVRRLTNAQAARLWASDMTPFQRIAVHLMMFMGLRRAELLRLKVTDVRDNHILVNGKGGIGGKPRIVPLHRETREIFARWLEARDALIAAAKKRRPNLEVPPDLLVYKAKNHINEYTEDGLDRAVCGKLSLQLGFKFTNHDLRRTFARRLFQSGVKLRTIADLLGHESISETEKYIGTILDDMVSAMENLEYEE